MKKKAINTMAQINSLTCSRSLQKLLQESIDYYCRIEAVYLKMDNGSSDSMISSTRTAIRELSTLFNSVEDVENTIKRLLEENTVHPDTKTDSLMELRKKVLKRIYDRNRFLHTKVENIKSLLQHELNKMNTGQNAMRGYKSLPAENKGILTGSF